MKKRSEFNNVGERWRGGGGPERGQRACYSSHCATWATVPCGPLGPGEAGSEPCDRRSSDFSALLSERQGRPPHTPFQPAGAGLWQPGGGLAAPPPRLPVSEQQGTGASATGRAACPEPAGSGGRDPSRLPGAASEHSPRMAQERPRQSPVTTVPSLPRGLTQHVFCIIKIPKLVFHLAPDLSPVREPSTTS